MTDLNDEKETLRGYLEVRRSDLVSTLDGLGEYDIRRPMTKTSTNLLGLVKHVASTELGYFTEVFGRDPGMATPWMDEDAEPNADMFAAADETRDDILALHRHAARMTEQTVAELELDAPGVVAWWAPERRDVTLRRILVHMISETSRHAGHADIVRELIDGRVGQRPGDQNIPFGIDDEWVAYRERVEAAATAAAGVAGA